MDDNELISVCNNLKQLQKVMIEINDVVEGMTDTNLVEDVVFGIGPDASCNGRNIDQYVLWFVFMILVNL